MTIDEARKVLRAMAASFPATDVTPEVIVLWCKDLEEHTETETLAAIQHLRRTRTAAYWPTYAELRTAIATVNGTRHRPTIDVTVNEPLPTTHHYQLLEAARARLRAAT